jgi:DamX protein
MNTLNEVNFNPNYWRRYGFNRDPFGEHTQKEFFVPDSWEEYLDLLPQFARFCDTLLLIIGRSGVGKSTLINLFTTEQTSDTDIFALRATDCPNAHHFLKLLNQRYGAPYDAANQAPASEQLHQQLEFLRENKASRLLIIDAAEQLPLDMRQLCLQIIQQQNALTTCLPIILVGEDNLSTQMHALLTPTTAQKCLYTIHVESFSENETKQYLHWCCTQASGDKVVAFPFSPEDVATIFQQSDGVIGAINPIAQRLLSERTKPGFTLPPYLRGKVVWWCGAIIIITILLIVYQQLTKPSTLDEMISPPATTTAASAASTTPPNPAPSSSMVTPRTGTAAVPTEPINTTPSQGASGEDLPVSAKSSDAADPENATPMPTPLPKSSDKAGSATNITAATPTTNAAPSPAAPTLTTTPVATSPAPASSPKADANLFNQTMEAALQEHQARVLHTPPSHYTLQLIASPNLHKVQKFILQHQLGSVALIVSTERDDKFFYIVLYGNFPTRVIAAKEQAHLNKTKNIQPWLRTYKSVQELITADKPVVKTVHKKVVHKKITEKTDSSESW